MAPLLEDPRIRQTWNQFSQNAEQATETAAAGIWTFQHQYINPCFASIAAGFESCTGHCVSDREDRARRLRERGRTRGRAELSFDFYDDWDNQDDGIGSGGLLGGWDNDELDRLLAGSGSNSGAGAAVDKAPGRRRGMSYGTRGGKRKSLEPDPTVIPSTSALGFLGRLPFKFGGTLRYKPSAADLQDHPGVSRTGFSEEEGEPLIPDEDTEDERDDGKGHRRQRSSTASSGETSDSFRSRGDLFPSDGEDDAVPLSDEFAMVLERRMTGSGQDDRSSGKTKSTKGKRPVGFQTLSTKTQSLDGRPKLDGDRTSSIASFPSTPTPDTVETPSMTELQLEEEMVRMEEDEEVERKRQAAARLAVARGLHVDGSIVTTEDKAGLPMNENIPPLEPQTKNDDAKKTETATDEAAKGNNTPKDCPRDDFVPARLPNFG